MPSSNTVTNDYYPVLARQLFELALEIREETGVTLDFINLSGGIGVNYRPEQEPNDIAVIGEGFVKPMRKFSRQQVWDMSKSLRNWDVLCWLHTVT